MIGFATRVLMGCIALLTAVSASAQSAATLPYKDLALSPQGRAADLVHRMTLKSVKHMLNCNNLAFARRKNHVLFAGSG